MKKVMQVSLLALTGFSLAACMPPPHREHGRFGGGQYGQRGQGGDQQRGGYGNGGGQGGGGPQGGYGGNGGYGGGNGPGHY